MNGFPCSGKTTFATKIIARTGIKKCSTDEIRIRTGACNPFDAGSRSMAYNRLLDETRTLLEQDNDLLLDATFSRQLIRKKVYDICRATRTSLIVVTMDCPENILRERMRTRLQSRSFLPELKFDTLDFVTRENQPIVEEEFDGIHDVSWLKFDTAHNVAKQEFRMGKPKFAEDVRILMNSMPRTA